VNKAAFSALEQLGVSVWAPLDCQSATKIAQSPSQNTCQMIFPGDNPLVAVWVDSWDDYHRQMLAKILRFLLVPLKRCIIIGPGETESISALTVLASNINKLFAFGSAPKKLVDSLGTIEYVESIPLSQVISNPTLKEQVLHELWEHRLPTD
jgi:hypothetical protein